MSANDPTDKELMERIARSDAGAFRILLNRYSDMLYAFAWRLTSSKTDAEDLVQDVFFKVWRSAAQWRPEAKLSAWLHRIAYNRYIDMVRRVRPTESEIPETASPEQTLLKKSESDEIAQAVNTLPERQKEALVLCYHEGMTAREAAEMLSVSPGALEALLFRARQTLKEKLFKGKEKQ